MQITDPLDHQLPPAGRYTLVQQQRQARHAVQIPVSASALARAHRERFEARESALAGFLAHGRHPLIRVHTEAPLLNSATRVLRRQRAIELPSLAGSAAAGPAAR